MEEMLKSVRGRRGPAPSPTLSIAIFNATTTDGRFAAVLRCEWRPC
jgi:hypothetical protein